MRGIPCPSTAGGSLAGQKLSHLSHFEDPEKSNLELKVLALVESNQRLCALSFISEHPHTGNYVIRLARLESRSLSQTSYRSNHKRMSKDCYTSSDNVIITASRNRRKSALEEEFLENLRPPPKVNSHTRHLKSRWEARAG